MSARTRRPRRSGWKWLVLALVLGVGLHYSRGLVHRIRKPAYPPNAFYQVKRADMLVSISEDGALRALNETIVRSALEWERRLQREPW